MGLRRTFTTLAILSIVFVALASPVRAETLTLEQCIDIALQNNGSADYGLLSAREGYHSAKQDVWSAWGNILPNLNNSTNYSHTRWKSEGGSFIDPTTGDVLTSEGGAQTSTSWSTSFSLSQTFFNGGANWYRVAQAYHNRTFSQESMRRREDEVIYGVNQRYFGLLKAKKLVEVQEASVKRSQEFLKTIESKYELGSASLSEVLKARVQLGSDQLELLNRKNNVEVAKADMNKLLSRDVDADVDVADVGDKNLTVPTYEEASQMALQESPQMLSQRASLRSAKDDLGIARATLFPSFEWSIRRSYYPPSRSELLKFRDLDGRWSIGGTFSIPIFNGFNRKTSISNARVGLKYAKEGLDQQEKSVLAGVKFAHLAVKLAAETRDLAQQTEASAQEDFNLAQEKYNLGAATILDLLDAQASLTKAQNDNVNAQFDYYVAVAALDLTTGNRR